MPYATAALWEFRDTHATKWRLGRDKAGIRASQFDFFPVQYHTTRSAESVTGRAQHMSDVPLSLNTSNHMPVTKS